jgi:hypothetical protein
MTEIKTNQDIVLEWSWVLAEGANDLQVKLSPVQSYSSLPVDSEYRLLAAELEIVALSLKNLLRKDADLIVQADSCFQKGDLVSVARIDADLRAALKW